MNFLEQFSYKLCITMLAIITMNDMHHLNAMKQRRSEDGPFCISKTKMQEERIADHRQKAFQMYANLQLIEDYPTLPIDIISIISLNACISNAITEVSPILQASRHEPEKIITLIKSLHDIYAFNLSVQILKTSLAHVGMTLNDFWCKKECVSIPLLFWSCNPSKNELLQQLNCIKIMLAVAGAQVRTLISETENYFHYTALHQAARLGHIEIVKVILKAFGDNPQELIDLKGSDGRTALDLAKFAKDDNSTNWRGERLDQNKLQEVIDLLEVYRSNNQ